MSSQLTLTEEKALPHVGPVGGRDRIELLDVLRGFAMSLFYASIIVLLAQQEKWRTRFLPLACVGRMALTNYLLQSLICTTIFNSYGFGLYGKVRPSLGLILTLLIYVVQIPLSVWWLRRFQFGPAEWLWRSATYASLQPMRKA